MPEEVVLKLLKHEYIWVSYFFDGSVSESCSSSQVLIFSSFVERPRKIHVINAPETVETQNSPETTVTILYILSQEQEFKRIYFSVYLFRTARLVLHDFHKIKSVQHLSCPTGRPKQFNLNSKWWGFSAALACMLQRKTKELNGLFLQKDNEKQKEGKKQSKKYKLEHKSLQELFFKKLNSNLENVPVSQPKSLQPIA